MSTYIFSINLSSGRLALREILITVVYTVICECIIKGLKKGLEECMYR